MHFPYNEVARLPRFRVSPIIKSQSAAQKVPTEDFFISFDKIENPLMCAMDLAAETGNLLLMTKCFIHAAELRMLQGEMDKVIEAVGFEIEFPFIRIYPMPRYRLPDALLYFATKKKKKIDRLWPTSMHVVSSLPFS